MRKHARRRGKAVARGGNGRSVCQPPVDYNPDYREEMGSATARKPVWNSGTGTRPHSCPTKSRNSPRIRRNPGTVRGFPKRTTLRTVWSEGRGMMVDAPGVTPDRASEHAGCRLVAWRSPLQPLDLSGMPHCVWRCGSPERSGGRRELRRGFENDRHGFVQTESSPASFAPPGGRGTMARPSMAAAIRHFNFASRHSSSHSVAFAERMIS